MTEELFRSDAYLRSCAARIVEADAFGVRLDRTVFYPEGGGQPGDTGTLTGAGGTLKVVDTRKHPATGEPVHVIEAGAILPAPGDAVTATLDWERRYRHMRMHTCLHLLCSLVIGAVTGGALNETKGRLDFDLPDTALDRDSLTAGLNRLVAGDHEVLARWIADAELEATPDLVRTMSVKPPMGTGRVRLLDIAGIDLQPCGGTHVLRTGEIGSVVVGKIENKGRHNRRVNIAFAA
ncbi:MAG: alanyl-tRNA editing protein [Alphaproteobacteria bacterium]